MGIASNLRKGQAVVLPDGRMLERDEYGGYHLHGDGDKNIGVLDNPATVQQLQRKHKLPATGILDDRTKKAIRGK